MLHRDSPWPRTRKLETPNRSDMTGVSGNVPDPQAPTGYPPPICETDTHNHSPIHTNTRQPASSLLPLRSSLSQNSVLLSWLSQPLASSVFS